MVRRRGDDFWPAEIPGCETPHLAGGGDSMPRWVLEEWRARISMRSWVYPPFSCLSLCYFVNDIAYNVSPIIVVMLSGRLVNYGYVLPYSSFTFYLILSFISVSTALCLKKRNLSIGSKLLGIGSYTSSYVSM